MFGSGTAHVGVDVGVDVDGPSRLVLEVMTGTDIDDTPHRNVNRHPQFSARADVICPPQFSAQAKRVRHDVLSLGV
eukprot:3938678-Rhodomonas_salina.2